MTKKDYYVSHFVYFTLALIMGALCFVSLKIFVKDFSPAIIAFGIVCVLGGIAGYALLIREIQLNMQGDNTD